MKLILAIIRPEKFRDVKDHLQQEGVAMMTVLDVRGRGQQKGFVEEFRGIQKEVDLHRKVMLLIGVNNSYAQKTVSTIIKSAKTNGGRIGDGKIFVLDLDDCIRIRTGEKGILAIGGDSEEVISLRKTLNRQEVKK